MSREPCGGGPRQGSMSAMTDHPARRRLTTAATVLGLVAAALLVSACQPAATTVVSPTAAPPRTVAVTSTGSAEAVPDAAKATLTVQAQDPSSAKAAQQAAASATTKVIDALKAAGVDEKDIATQAIQVGPTYNYTNDGGQILTGYAASQTLTVTFRDLDTAGATLDAVVKAGGNTVRIESLMPFVTDPSIAAGKAREQAVDIAQKQAEQYASLLGFELGPVASVSEATTTPVQPPVAYADTAAEAQKVATPIQAGTQEVTVTLNITWSIAD